ncbi:hypothetical protein [Microseira wollei]|uniref:Uncharacterized protein n=1 Tax=Microseira wollei NIES-4236 TaxID=2530354 RepID=A0AAV3XJ26_9CYAN|nr:hypothetical protein [Microseira wollei]GET39462.1 hypothetical protein MiSe_42310 [Microseira wollei NIES-4236]
MTLTELKARLLSLTPAEKAEIIQLLYHVRSITHNQKPGHGTINAICLSEISMMPCPYATTL